jgi:hypothetical protein
MGDCGRGWWMMKVCVRNEVDAPGPNVLSYVYWGELRGVIWLVARICLVLGADSAKRCSAWFMLAAAAACGPKRAIVQRNAVRMILW